MGGSRTEDTSISLSVHGVTASAGADYSAPTSVALTIPAEHATGTAVLTLTAVDDDLHEGEEQLAVRGSNADPGLPVVGARIAIADNDTAPTEIALSVDTHRIPEDTGLQELAVTATLEGGGMRTADTRVTLFASNMTTSDADYSASPVVLMIASNQRRGTATMLLVPMDDSIDEDDEILELRGTTGDLDLPVVAQQVTITDDDTAAVSVTPTELTVLEGGSGSYSVVLASEPTADVTVTVGGHDGTDVSVSPGALTFTSENWTAPQTVTVSAARDDDAAADAVALSHSVSGAGEYQHVAADSVTVTITDDDSAGVSVEPTALTVTEGGAGGGSYTVALDTRPSADVTVTVSGHAGSDVTVSPATFTFTAANWTTPQTVTVTAGEDHDAVADPSVTLSHAVSGTGE